MLRLFVVLFSFIITIYASGSDAKEITLQITGLTDPMISNQLRKTVLTELIQRGYSITFGRDDENFKTLLLHLKFQMVENESKKYNLHINLKASNGKLISSTKESARGNKELLKSVSQNLRILLDSYSEKKLSN